MTWRLPRQFLCIGSAAHEDSRIGQGFDVHALVPGRPLILGGVEIQSSRGLLGHSDADVLLHAITDAILGAAALGDIGQQFPDTDAAYKDVDSRLLLQQAAQSVARRLAYRKHRRDSHCRAAESRRMWRDVSNDRGIV